MKWVVAWQIAHNFELQMTIIWSHQNREYFTTCCIFVLFFIIITRSGMMRLSSLTYIRQNVYTKLPPGIWYSRHNIKVSFYPTIRPKSWDTLTQPSGLMILTQIRVKPYEYILTIFFAYTIGKNSCHERQFFNHIANATKNIVTVQTSQLCLVAGKHTAGNSRLHAYHCKCWSIQLIGKGNDVEICPTLDIKSPLMSYPLFCNRLILISTSNMWNDMTG